MGQRFSDLFTEDEFRTCKVCGIGMCYYENPLLRMYHLGKYKNLIICLECFKNRFNLIVNDRHYINKF